MEQTSGTLRAWLSRASASLGRSILAGAMLILGLGRVGLFSTSGTVTTVPTLLYGGLLIAGGLGLLVTDVRGRQRVAGRVAAGLSACVLAGFATDLVVAQGSMTSSVMLFWLAASSAFEALANHDC